jgi:hypothetical protein
MQTRTSASTNKSRSPDRRAGLIAIAALAAATLALLLPASLPSHHGSTVNAAAAQASTAPLPGTQPASRERVPRFLGYVEFDWDPDAPGGVPGFDPWPQAPQQP